MPIIKKKPFNGNDRYYLCAENSTKEEISLCKQTAATGKFSKSKDGTTYTEIFANLVNLDKYIECETDKRELEYRFYFNLTYNADGILDDMYAYQVAGVEGLRRRMSKYGFALLADEPGLGKTKQAIDAMDAIKKPTLIVCPLVVRSNWVEECKKWSKYFVGSEDIGIYEKIGDRIHNVTIVNYDKFSRYATASELIKDLWRTGGFGLIICDEAHKLKSVDAIRTKSIKKLASKIPLRLALTGTPIENRPAEIYGLLNTFDAMKVFKKFRLKNDFERRYCNFRHNGFGYVADGAKNEEELSLTLKSTVMIRRLKKDVLKQLPPKTYKFVYLDKSNAIEKVNNKISRSDLDKTLSDPNFGRFGSLAEALKELALAKLPLAVEYIKNSMETLDKLVIIAYHRDVIALLEEQLKAYSPVIVKGGITSNARDNAVKSFQNDPNCKIFIGQIEAAGVGITLTAANHLYFVEPWWVPSDIAQACDRIHRIGQTLSANIEFLITKGGADEYIFDKVIKKNSIIEKILDK